MAHVGGEGRPHVQVDYDPFAVGGLADHAPSTEPQREIWTSAVINDDASAAFNQALHIRLTGDLDAEALRAALTTVMQRHDALRSSFASDGLTFVVEEAPALPWRVEDCRGPDAAERVARAAGDEVAQPIDVTRGPLFRVRLCRAGEREHHLFLTLHHIICDGWSTGVLFRELGALYAAAVDGKPASLPPAPSFASFARERAAEVGGPGQQRATAYWTERYRTLPPTIEMPLSRPRPERRSYRAASVELQLEQPLVAGLRRVGARQNATLVATLFASFAAFIGRITALDDVVIGLSAAGQPFYGIPGLVGHCVNLLPVRAAVPFDEPFQSVIRAARGELLDAQEHQTVTFGSLLEQLRLPRDPSRVPLVPVVFNLDRETPATLFGSVQATVCAVPRQYETFEWFVNAVEGTDGIVLECSFNADLFDAEFVQRLLSGYSGFLEAAMAHPETPVGTLPLVEMGEGGGRRGRLERWSGRPAAGLADGSFLPWVREQVDADPSRVAVEDERGQRWTYGELWTYAGRVAGGLAARGVAAGALVGVRMSRGAPMLGVVLGILRRGAAYLPLDPDFPEERLRYMVESGGAGLVVSDDPTPLEAATLVTDEALVAGADRQPEGPAPQAADLAYVIYTSGSTGRPKGVEVPHGALRNFLGSMRDEPGLSPDDVLLAVTTLSFDIAGLELFLPLCVGARVVIVSGETATNGGALAERLEASKATVMQATPATWRMVLDAGWAGRLRQALCGGEALPPELAPVLRDRADAAWNLYGPTETTIWSALARVADGPITVGRPIANTRIYVLDPRGQVVPDGVSGELWIAGAGVARGYRSQPELTEERFRADPWVTGERMYRTGDLGRWRGDGLLEHLGRLDSQVKVHGFRIELGEIEAALEGLDEVRRAVVAARGEAQDRRLVAYIVFEQGRDLLAGEIRRALGATLPAYMVPGLVVPLDGFPLTPNGKVDRNALRDPLEAAASVERAHEPPEGPVEGAIAAVWQELLGVGQVGRHDNFFELGGHSLLAMRAVAEVDRRSAVRIHPRDMFFRSLSQLALVAAAPAGGELGSDS